MGGGYGRVRFDNSIRGIGWSLMHWATNGIWGPVLFFWFIRIFIKDSELVNWLFVLFSNISMLGPVLIYWLSTVLIIVGYAVDGFKYMDLTSLFKLVVWIFASFLSSYYQEAWIDEI